LTAPQKAYPGGIVEIGQAITHFIGMISTVEALCDERITFLAAQVANNTWYPYSFLAPIE
jgi:hypothetical protein